MTAVNLSLDFSTSGIVNNPSQPALSTGFAALDVMLPHNGWPIGGVTEIFCPEPSQFALPLVLPALARLSQAKRWLAMIAPPNAPTASHLKSHDIDISQVLIIHPHATSNGLWAVERALRAGTCAAVLSWVNSADHHAMQDLRGAALAGNCCGIVFRPEWAITQPSAASQRLRLTPTADHGIYVELLEQRSTRARSALFIEPR
jgi:cell division inhibitor SulA